MGEPEASKIGLFTVADYAWNAAAYDSARSWDASLREFSRGDAKTLAALRWFAGAKLFHAPQLRPQGIRPRLIDGVKP
jgi:hyaluronoglucosaminidase